MNYQDFISISPEIIIALTAILVFSIDLFVANKRILIPISCLGLLFSFMLTIGLWNGWFVGVGEHAFFESIKIDEFGLFFKVLLIVSAIAVIACSWDYLDTNIESKGEFLGLLLLSITGMVLLVSSVELITIWVALELTAIPLVALVALGKKETSLEAAIKFLILSAVSSVVILYGLVYLYGFSGSTYFDDIFNYLSIIQDTPSKDFVYGNFSLLIGAVLVILGITFKLAAFPFQMWVPDVYQGAPTPITAYLSVVSKAAGFAVLLRIIYGALGVSEFAYILGNLVAIIAVFSMTIGNVMALRQNDIKRLLAYSTIAHAGYLLVGVASLSFSGKGGYFNAGPQSVLYYLAGYAFTNLTAFLVIIGVSKSIGTYQLSGFVGLWKKSPLISFILAISIISLLGIPPTVGFMAKVFIFSAAVNTDLTWLAIVAVINSVISAYYYLRILKISFVETDDNGSEISVNKIITGVTLMGVIGIIVLGLFPSLVLEIAEIAVISIVKI